jgi:Fe-S-cluster containining protein
MKKLLDRYGELLNEVDVWFRECTLRHPQQIACHAGCSSCCRGLFDITLLDAIYLKRGFEQLPEPVRRKISRVAAERLNSLTRQFPLFVEPWILNKIPEPEWDEIMPEEDETPCPLLSRTGDCLVYGFRPMTCRLNGIPLIDESGEELFDEWCTLNFVSGEPLEFEDLRFGFTELFAQELLLFRELIRKMTGKTINEVDTIIPAAVLLDFDRVIPLVKQMVDQSAETTKFPANPLRS